MHFRQILLVLLTALPIITTYGQQPLENSLLWKIEHDEMESPSYLFGTVHILCPDDLVMDDRINGAVMATGRLVLELDFDDPGIMQNIQAITMFSDGTNAEDYLTEEELETVSLFFTDSMKMPFQVLSSVKPFFLTAMVSLNFLKCNPPASWETTLVELSKAEGMEVIGLETPQEQMAIIERVPLEQQGQLLVESIRKYDDSREMMTRMYALYAAENLEGLDELTREYMGEEYSEIEEDMLQGRNRAWVPGIIELIREQPSFIAVGAAHLPGEEGLIRLLRSAGYTVSPVLK